jgi:ABC-type transport system, involved in lipoprotein release, permease component
MNIKTNFLLSIRHLIANKINTSINIAGLILGLGIVSVVVVFVLNEHGYNSCFKNKENIYRVLNFNSEDNTTWANTPFIIEEALADKFPEVDKWVHTYNIGNIEIKKDEDFIHEPKMFCTESSFFDIFGVKILQGSLSGFDHTDNKVLISKELSQEYFRNDNPVGKLLTLRYLGKEHPMEITAVFEDFPQNSTLKASIIAGIDFGLHHLVANLVSTSDQKPDEKELKESWKNNLFFTNYILLKKGVRVDVFEKKLHQLGIEHSTADNNLSLSLQPLTDIYFGSGKIVDNNGGDQGDLSMLYILMFIGALILIIACINYLNLTTAQAVTQTKALSIRKICGASRKSLIAQMILESALVSLIALPFALQLAQVALPFISQLLGKSYQLTLNYQSFMSIGILTVITMSTGILSGLIVSLKVTSFNLSETLKGFNIEKVNRHFKRKIMVIFQICVFIILIAIMILVQKQVSFAFSKDLGFAKEGLIRVPVGDHNYGLFKQEILKNPNILNVSGALWLPPHESKMNISIPKVDEPQKIVNVYGLFVDYHFVKTMGLKLLRGTDFDETKNNSGVIVNESAIKTLGLKEVIGQQIAFGTVIGVVSDFNMYSIHEAIHPMIIGLNPSMCREIAIRINTDNVQQTIAFLKDSWKATGGTTPFEFEFTNDILKKLYAADIRFSKTIALMAGIAILIASLGLFGLSLLISQQKTKEIGIRKINGARIIEVIAMLNRDFLRWVVIAFVIACPISFYATNKWLDNFAYRTELNWWIFVLAGLLAMTIALMTVSWQSWRAATRNPVEALRYE